MFRPSHSNQNARLLDDKYRRVLSRSLARLTEARMKRSIAILLPILFLTAAYIYVWPTASVPYFAAVMVHPLGCITPIVLLILAPDKILVTAEPATHAGS